MRPNSIVLCLWPGLAVLWLDGCWKGLLTAVGFAVVLNFAIAANFLWVDWVNPFVEVSAWLVAGAVWSIGFSVSWWRTSRREPAVCEEESEGLIREAQAEYLQGNWYEVERILQGVLRRDPDDIDAQLMFATLLRRTHRSVQARAVLEQLQRLECSRKWRLEIQRESERIESLESAQDSMETAEASGQDALEQSTNKVSEAA